MTGWRLGLVALAAALACVPEREPGLTLADSTHIRSIAGKVDDSLLASPAPDDWPAHGRTRSEQRFSPLTGIDTTNVGRLSLAWAYDLGGYTRVEATPIVVGGVMYVTGPWNVVHAVDARTGSAIWTHDPRVPRRTVARSCCHDVNRGVAVYRGRVYVGTLDGRLIALDAGTGARLWEVQTTDSSAPYAITGAPRVGAGLVFIGNGGADLGVRGYVSAYDAASGALRWRTWTVPGDPAAGFESPAMRAAAATWRGRWWEYGGGGTVWDTIVYDDETRQLYVGTGNGSPWLRSARSPGGGDNLYLASILALDAETGTMRWYYQTTPGESWDYTATQPIVLADVAVGGARRRVLLQAPKNGFFYVLDRDAGRLLSATGLVPMAWATGVDSTTGRPREDPAGVPQGAPVAGRPSPTGAHNWHPVSWSPATGLMYLAVIDRAQELAVDSAWQYAKGQINRGILIGPTADPGNVLDDPGPGTLDLVAWDPVNRRAAWRVRHEGLSASGTLAVAGGLVFAGRIPRQLAAYRARDGALEWAFDTGAGVEAGPISYAVDGVQYVAVLVGNGVPVSRLRDDTTRADYRGRARIVAFALDARGPRVPQRDAPPHPAPDVRPDEPAPTDAADLARGNLLYDKYCVRCHGPAAESPGPYPDLRFSSADVRRRFGAIVRAGTLLDRGMPWFGAVLTEDDSRSLQAYVLERARLAMRPGSAR